MPRHYGVSQLARETGYSQQAVTNFLKQGFSVQQVKDRAAARASGQMKPLAGNARGSKVEQRALANGAVTDTGVSVTPNPAAYTPRRGRPIGGGYNGKSGAKETTHPVKETTHPVTGRPAGKGTGSGSTAAGPAATRLAATKPEAAEWKAGGRAPTIVQGETMQQAQLRKEIAIANQRTLEFKERNGELVSRVQMENWLSGAFRSAQDILLRIGPELRDRLAAERDPVKVEQIVNGEVERALRRVSQAAEQLARDAGDASEYDGLGEHVAVTGTETSVGAAQ